jgi:hypothetical protein
MKIYGRHKIPVMDQFLDVRRIDIRDFGQCRSQKRRASILADQTGNVIPHTAFKNGNGLVFHRRQEVSWLARNLCERAPWVSTSIDHCRWLASGQWQSRYLISQRGALWELEQQFEVKAAKMREEYLAAVLEIHASEANGNQHAHHS